MRFSIFGITCCTLTLREFIDSDFLLFNRLHSAFSEHCRELIRRKFCIMDINIFQRSASYILRLKDSRFCILVKIHASLIKSCRYPLRRHGLNALAKSDPV